MGMEGLLTDAAGSVQCKSHALGDSLQDLESSFRSLPRDYHPEVVCSILGAKITVCKVADARRHLLLQNTEHVE